MATYTLIVKVTTSEEDYDLGTARSLANILMFADEAGDVWDRAEQKIEEVHVSTPDGKIALST